MPNEADSAHLRLAFEECCLNQIGWTLPLSNINHPWHLLYERVRDDAGGLTLSAHVAYLDSEIARLEAELCRERRKNAGVPLYIRQQALEIR